MSDAALIHRLTRELRKAGSPLARMKVLARAWRSLQRLAPDQRAKLAQEVGIEGAEDLVERMATRHGRIKPAVILQALERARGADPRQLRTLFDGLRDPRRRGSILRKGLEALTARLDEDEAAPASAAQEGAARSVRAAARSGTDRTVVEVSPAERPTPARAGQPERKTPATEPAAPEPAPDEKAGGARDERDPEPPPRPVPLPPPAVVRTGGGRESRPAKPAAPPPRPPGSSPAVESSRGAGSPLQRVEPARPTPPKMPPRRPRPIATRLRERVEEADGIVRRLRVLRALSAAGRDLDLQALRGVLALFDPPWARRRALDALLAARAPARLEDALTLVDELDSPSARRWCLGTILDSWDLSEPTRRDLKHRRRNPAPAKRS